MSNCPRCGAEVGDSRFCSACGLELALSAPEVTSPVPQVANAYCGRCGSRVAGDQRVCTDCGAVLSFGATPIAPDATIPLALTAAPILSASYPKQKSAGWAMFWNFLWPGVGYLYAGVRTSLGTTFVVLTLIFRLIGFTGIGLIVAFPAWLIMAAWSMSNVNRLVAERNRDLGYISADDVIAARKQAP